MTNKRYFFVQVGVFVLLVGLIIGGVVGANILLQKQSNKLMSLRLESATVEMQQSALVQAKKDVERYNELDKIAKSVVPQDKDQAKTVREIVGIAAKNGIPIKSVSFETSNLGEAKAKAAAPAEGEAGAPAPTQPATPSVSQVKPVNGINGVFTLPIEVESAGRVSYPNFLKFLEDLEKNRRTAHVSNINLEPSPAGNTLEFTLTLNAYVKP